MKNEVMLERCLEMAMSLNEHDKMCFDYNISHNDPDGINLGCRLAAIVIELKADIAAEECKAAGKLSPLNAAKRIIKSAKSNNSREYIHGSWMQDGMQCYCDGYHGVRLNNPLPTEEIPPNSERMDLSGVIKSAKEYAGAVLKLPTVSELKAHIKFEKANKKVNRDRSPVTYDFGPDLPLVNAEYLLNMLELLPGCKAKAKFGSSVGPIYFEAEAGDGVLLPVRRAAK